MAPQDSVSLKYWSCPHSLDICGLEPMYIPLSNGVVSFIEPRRFRRSETDAFDNNAMCRYRIVFPQEAGEFDQIAVMLTAKANATVWLTET